MQIFPKYNKVKLVRSIANALLHLYSSFQEDLWYIYLCYIYLLYLYLFMKHLFIKSLFIYDIFVYSQLVRPNETQTEGVRRSQRTRTAPLDWFRNERIRYDRRDSGMLSVLESPQCF